MVVVVVIVVGGGDGIGIGTVIRVVYCSRVEGKTRISTSPFSFFSVVLALFCVRRLTFSLTPDVGRMHSHMARTITTVLPSQRDHVCILFGGNLDPASHVQDITQET